MASAEDLMDEEVRVQRLRGCLDRIAFDLAHTVSTYEAARELIEEARRHALALFPDKAAVFDLVVLPRFHRILDERALVG